MPMFIDWVTPGPDTLKSYSIGNDRFVRGSRSLYEYGVDNGRVFPKRAVLEVPYPNNIRYKRSKADPVLVNNTNDRLIGYNSLGRLEDSSVDYDRGHLLTSALGGNQTYGNWNLVAEKALFNQGIPEDPNNKFGKKTNISMPVIESVVNNFLSGTENIGNESFKHGDTAYVFVSPKNDILNKNRYVKYPNVDLLEPDSINTSIIVRRNGINNYLYNNTIPTDGTESVNSVKNYDRSVKTPDKGLLRLLEIFRKGD